MNTHWTFMFAAALLLASPHSSFAEDPIVAKVKAEIAPFCTGNAGEYGDSFLLREDLNNDKIDDYIFDYGESPCASGFCGSAGCTVSIWLSSNGNFKEAYSSNLRSWVLVEGNGRKSLVTGMHGSACNLPGAAECNIELKFKGTKVAKSRFKGKIDWQRAQ